MRSCDTGACLVVTPQPDGSVELHSTLDPLFRTVRFTAEEWAAHVAGLKAQGRAELQYELVAAARALPYDWEFPNPDAVADWIEAQTEEATDGRS
jgi:hypothetical protein